MPSLSVKNICHRFDKNSILEDVSFSLEENEIICLLGPSGCGKTTLLRLIAGLEKLQKGHIYIQDKEMAGPKSHINPEKRDVGLLFQDYALFPHQTVLDNVKFGLSKFSQQEKHKQALHYIDSVDLKDHMFSYPHMLSGGQQQRVALARVLAPHPKLLLLDEPFSGLDKTLRDQVRDHTLHILKKHKISTVLVTHDPEEAMFMADRIALMNEGKIIQIGSPTELYYKPKTSFVASFLGEINTVSATYNEGYAETLIGRFPAKGYRNGEDVSVLIRPEAIEIDDQEDVADRIEAKVVTSKLLGRSSLIHLCVKKNGEHLHMHARVQGLFLPENNERIFLKIQYDQCFVFPNETQTIESKVA